VPPMRICFTFESRNAYFGAFCGQSEHLLLHCNTSRSRVYTSSRPVRLPSVTFQAVAQSNALKLLQKMALNIITSGSDRIRGKFNHCQRQNTESRQQQLSQLFFRRSCIWKAGVMDLSAPLDPPLALARRRSKCTTTTDKRSKPMTSSSRDFRAVAK